MAFSEASVSLILVFLAVSNGETAEDAMLNCEQSGFRLGLPCIQCVRLEKMVLPHLDENTAEQWQKSCQDCCQDEKPRVYAGARILVDKAWLKRRYFELSEFVDNDLAQFGDRVKVRYINGRRPQLALYESTVQPTDNTTPDDVVSLGGWKRDQIVSFLNLSIRDEE